MTVSYLAHVSILRMEATCSSATLTDFLQITRRFIPEDRTLQTEGDSEKHAKLSTHIWKLICEMKCVQGRFVTVGYTECFIYLCEPRQVRYFHASVLTDSRCSSKLSKLHWISVTWNWLS
jgi:hypothetical protein